MLAVLPAASANAAAVHHKSTVTIDYDGSFFGIVDSRAARCVRSRTVQLLYSSSETGKAEVLGTDVTDGYGNWRINPGKIQSGFYRAKATRKVYRRHGRRHVCDPAKSQFVAIF